MQQRAMKKITPDGQSVIGYLNPVRMILHLWRFKGLIKQLAYREVVSRHKGSFLGLGWSFVQPLLMLVVYTFVFSVVFNARWGMQETEGRAGFALTLFMGLITYGIFTEMVTGAPALVLDNANYVKKVVFPLEILPVVRMLSVMVNAFFRLVILLVGLLLINHAIAWTVVLLPIVWLPLLLFTLGCGFFLAALGVFVRDVGATVEVITTMFLFLTPIFYPVEAVPQRFRIFNAINPIACFVESARRVFIWGQLPDWYQFAFSMLFSLVVSLFGFVWFMKSKRAFADVM